MGTRQPALLKVASRRGRREATPKSTRRRRRRILQHHMSTGIVTESTCITLKKITLTEPRLIRYVQMQFALIPHTESCPLIYQILIFCNEGKNNLFFLYYCL